MKKSENFFLYFIYIDLDTIMSSSDKLNKTSKTQF